MTRPRWTDDHCHLPSEGWQDVVAAARADGVERLIDVGVDVASSAAALGRASSTDGVWATAGVHPHEARHGVAGLEDLLGDPSCVAVGECGLDFHYDHSPRDAQADVFRAQIDLAHRRDLALVIHTREAWAETFDILDREGVPERTVFHCFTGGPDEATACLDRGGFLSFSGIVSFPSATDVQAAAAACPLDRLLVETDSPYLTPVPHRGRKNQPAWVPHVGSALAEATGRTVADVAAATWDNASRAYGLPEGRGRMTAPDLPPVAPSVHPHRRRLLIALGITAIAAPLLVIDNLPDDDGTTTTTTLGVVAPSIAPDDRPETGPPKGISVVTSSTTSSTRPIVVTTTTLPD